jgi:single-stranded DNA-binding protein
MSGYFDGAISGLSVLDACELREARNGTPYARVGIDHGNGKVWVTAFGDLARSIAGTIAKGDRVRAVGQVEVKLLERDGRQAAVATMIARKIERQDDIGAAHEGNDKRERPKVARQYRSKAPTQAAQGLYAPIGNAPPFNDEIPF